MQKKVLLCIDSKLLKQASEKLSMVKVYTFPISVAPSLSNNMNCSWGERAKEPKNGNKAYVSLLHILLIYDW